MILRCSNASNLVSLPRCQSSRSATMKKYLQKIRDFDFQKLPPDRQRQPGGLVVKVVFN
jgi:hypothetical protein